MEEIGSKQPSAVSRRRAFGILAVSAVAGSVAIGPATAQAPAEKQPRTDLFQSQRARFQSSARQVAAIKLPRAVEPAMRFEA